MRDTDKDWIRVGATEPYWGVLSVADYRSETLTEAARQRFFATGKVYVGNLLGLINKHLPQRLSTSRVLDFGCGVGRLLIPFAHHAEHVTGVDISPKMLETCASNCRLAGVENVALVESDDELSKAMGPYDLVNSILVLQHIPPDRALVLIEKLISLTAVGGCFALQLTYARARKFLLHEQGAARYYRRHRDTIVDMLPNREAHPEGTISMFDHDLNTVTALIQHYAGSPVLMLPTRDDDHLGVQFVGLRAK